ncbi:hypothetical protein A6E15_01725 [Natrinema saccharevitans]|uniref:DUF3311 domain-containing protein n=1 Tax=Natrinema saccharevitans TaxID=301967 RepID=A0A1S8ATG7_9EURY|nr:DUF3311 domain-containing protein [Natrinema saccharevitans]OLZ39779.1 hypothetical protein A6E15_01725 [Natrinema saccharevitans]
MRRTELLPWLAAAVVLAGLTVPWFLWGTSTVVAGLPVWLWWHVGWMCLASVAFWLFAQRAWGIGIETAGDGSSDVSRDGTVRGSESEAGGERR